MKKTRVLAFNLKNASSQRGTVGKVTLYHVNTEHKLILCEAKTFINKYTKIVIICV